MATAAPALISIEEYLNTVYHPDRISLMGRPRGATPVERTAYIDTPSGLLKLNGSQLTGGRYPHLCRSSEPFREAPQK